MSASLSPRRPFGRAGLSAAEIASPGEARYVLGVLFVVYIINFVDRSVLAVLLEPIKAEFALSDTELGLLSGLVFALFYVTLGVPIGYLADRWSRRNIIVGSMLVWCSMTVACGAAASFVQLLFARIGVAAGEAGCVAPAQSMISDYFSPEQRTSALALFASGAPIGVFIALLVGGWLEQWVGWRGALIAVGLPGILVAFIVLFTVREPRRGMSGSAVTADSSPALSLADALRALAKRRTLLVVAVAGGLQGMVTYGVSGWLPAYYVRSSDLAPANISTILAVISGLVAGLGTILGGAAAGWLARRDRRWLLWIPAIATAMATPLYVAVLMTPNVYSSFALLVPAAFLSSVFIAPLLSVAHGVSGVALRGTGIALVLFVSNLLGIGGGALLVGVISDALSDLGPADSLRQGLLLLMVANVVAAAGYLLATRHLVSDWQDPYTASAARTPS